MPSFPPRSAYRGWPAPHRTAFTIGFPRLSPASCIESRGIGCVIQLSVNSDHGPRARRRRFEFIAGFRGGFWRSISSTASLMTRIRLPLSQAGRHPKRFRARWRRQASAGAGAYMMFLARWAFRRPFVDGNGRVRSAELHATRWPFDFLLSLLPFLHLRTWLRRRASTGSECPRGRRRPQDRAKGGGHK